MVPRSRGGVVVVAVAVASAMDAREAPQESADSSAAASKNRMHRFGSPGLPRCCDMTPAEIAAHARAEVAAARTPPPPPPRLIDASLVEEAELSV